MGMTEEKHDSGDSGNPSAIAPAPVRQLSGAVPGLQDRLSAQALGVQILGPLSEGPVSRTWRAKGAEGRPVALVVLREEVTDAEQERFVAALERVRGLADLPPGVLRVLEIASSQDAFLTELWTIGSAAGLPTLAWPPRRKLEFVRRAAEAIHALHRAGIIHGCLSEDNVLLSDALEPIVADAGTMSIPVLIEQHRDAAATVSFAAPELLEGAEPSVRSDVYSIGRLLQYAFKGDSVPEIAGALARCLARSPQGRYGAASEVAAALVAAADALPAANIEIPLMPAAAPKSASAEASHPAPTFEGVVEEKRAPKPPPLWLTPAGIALVLASVVVAFVAGTHATLRFALPVAVFAGGVLAAWGVRPSASTSRVLRIGFAAACGALLLVVDPLTLGYRVATAHALRGNPAGRRNAVDQIVQLGRDFEGVSLADVDLSGMDLRGANLRGTDLSGADLSRANLWGALVQDARLGGANASDADLQGTDLASAHDAERVQCSEGTHLPSPWRCRLMVAGASGRLSTEPAPSRAP
jgi:hypothetical protein